MNLPTVLALYCWQNPQYGPSQCSVQCLGEPQPSFTSESRAELQVSFSCAVALSSETTATVCSSQLAQLLCWPRAELKNLRYLLIQLFLLFLSNEKKNFCLDRILLCVQYQIGSCQHLLRSQYAVSTSIYQKHQPDGHHLGNSPVPRT